MNTKEYIENVLVTEARDFTPVKERIAETNILRLIHASVGITSEVSELFEAAKKASSSTLDRVNILEECGDILWYLGIAADTLDAVEFVGQTRWSASIPMHDEVLIKHIGIIGVHLAIEAGEFADLLVKKHVFYGKPMDKTKLLCKLENIHSEVERLLILSGFTLEQARERNIAKLKARYGSKFTEAAAQKRDLDAERKILEGDMSVSDKEALEALDECLDENTGDR